MSTLLITRGLPASGKTGFAKKWVDEDPHRRARVNRDDLRLMVYNHPFIAELEHRITTVQRAAVLGLLNSGLDVIADDTNLRPKYVREWRRWAAAHGHDLEVVEFPVGIEEAIARDAARDRPVGEEVIRRLSKYLRDGELAPVPDESPGEAIIGLPYVPPVGVPKAVVVDIDGTLALNTSGRSYYDLTRVSEDTPNENVIATLNMIRAAGHAAIIFCSGREDTCREDTEAWLEKYAGRRPTEPLYMRAADDKRRDSLVKLDLFDTHIRDRYNVLFVLDDRDQVVKAWRAIGLTVYQVAEGAF